jgi:hypothetical protein
VASNVKKSIITTKFFWFVKRLIFFVHTSFTHHILPQRRKLNCALNIPETVSAEDDGNRMCFLTLEVELCNQLNSNSCTPFRLDSFTAISLSQHFFRLKISCFM